MSYLHDQTGKLFDNRNKKTRKSQPDFTGKVRVDGKVFRVAAWLNSADEHNSEKNLTLRLDPEEVAQAREAEAKQRVAAGRDRKQAQGDLLNPGRGSLAAQLGLV